MVGRTIGESAIGAHLVHQPLVVALLARTEEDGPAFSAAPLERLGPPRGQDERADDACCTAPARRA